MSDAQQTFVAFLFKGDPTDEKTEAVAQTVVDFDIQQAAEQVYRQWAPNPEFTHAEVWNTVDGQQGEESFAVNLDYRGA